MSYGMCSDEPVLQQKQRQLAAKEFSAGVIAFYLAVNKRCSNLLHHNVFLSGADTSFLDAGLLLTVWWRHRQQ